MAKQRNYSVSDIGNWKFKDVGLPPEWAAHLGDITENFRMLIQGPSGHGKTEYSMMLAKMLTQYYGKVNFNSSEQGRSSTFQKAWMRNKMSEITPGKFMLCSKEKKLFDVWFESLTRPNSGRVAMLDSIDYMELKIGQYKKLNDRFKHKSIIMTCWDDPMDINSKKIKYNCDIKVEVKDFVAKIRSRFGGNKPFEIWPDRYKTVGPTLQTPLDFQAPAPQPIVQVTEAGGKMWVEKYLDYLVLIYEDFPVQLTEVTAKQLFEQYPQVKDIHELSVEWGGRWVREKDRVRVTDFITEEA